MRQEGFEGSPTLFQRRLDLTLLLEKSVKKPDFCSADLATCFSHQLILSLSAKYLAGIPRDKFGIAHRPAFAVFRQLDRNELIVR